MTLRPPTSGQNGEPTGSPRRGQVGGVMTLVRRWCGALLVVALVAALWGGVGAAEDKKDTAKAPEEGPSVVRLGVLLPLSGKHKRLGEAIMEAVTLTQVAMPGLEVVLADSAGRPAEAVREVERLAADPTVLAVLGPVGWDASRAAAERAQQLGLPLVTLSARDGLEQVGDFVFRGRPSIEEQSRLMGQFAIEELQLERVAILHSDDTLGRLAAEAFFEAARLAGGRVTAMVGYRTGSTNLQKAVEELVSKRAYKLKGRNLSRPPSGAVRKIGKSGRVDFDAVFIPDYDDTVALATKFLHFHDVPLANLGDGAAIQLLGTSLMHGSHLSETDGLISGALYPEFFDPSGTTEQTAGFIEAFEDAYKRMPQDLDAQVVDLVAILGAQLPVCAKVEGLDRQRRCMARRLGEMDPYDGLTGRQWFEQGGAPGRQFQIWVVNANGEVAPSY